MNQQDWWKTLFDKKYLDTYLDELTVERTNKEVGFAIQSVKLIPQDKILDLACGHGRHSIELARRGFNVVGLDYSEPFIEKAKEDAEEVGVKVEFMQGDMKALPFKEEFDVVLMLFTAFGYFDTKSNQHVLSEVNKALKPGGRFFIDVISGDAVIKRFSEVGEKEEGTNFLKIPRTFERSGLTITEVELFDPDEQLIHNHREWTDEEGNKKEYDFYLRVYTLAQYKEMLSKSRFEFKDVWGDFEGNPHNTNGNFRTIILAEKMKQ